MSSLQPTILTATDITDINDDDRTPQQLDLHSLSFDEIPLKAMQNQERIRYISALAFRLAQESSSALAIAQQLQTVLAHPVPSIDSACLPAANAPWLTALWPHFTLEVVPPGWLQFSLSDQGLGLWLQAIVDRSNQSIDNNNIRRHPNADVAGVHSDLGQSSIFVWQYTHARCCSLLNLAGREGLIQLSWNEAAGILAAPDPVPWLTPAAVLRCRHEAEQRLIACIQTLLDQWADSSRTLPQQLKQVHALCQEFDTFHRQCRIFNQMKRDDRALAQARLGLVLITQSLLRFALNELQLDAPTAL